MNAYEFKSRHYFSCQSCDNSKNGVFSSLVRLDYVVCSTMYDVLKIHVHLYILWQAYEKHLHVEVNLWVKITYIL